MEWDIRHISMHRSLEWLLAMDNTNLLPPAWGCPALFEGRCLRAARFYPVLVVNLVLIAQSELQWVEGFSICCAASIC